MNTYDLYAPTPKGNRRHGEVGVDSQGETYFLRRLTEADKMRIYDAYAINPSVFETLKEKKIKWFHIAVGNITRTISVEDLDKLLNGHFNLRTKLAWRAVWRGGPTIYIKDEAFDIARRGENGSWETISKSLLHTAETKSIEPACQSTQGRLC